MPAKKKLPATLTDAESMTPEQLATALKNAHVLETWITAVKAHAFEVLKNGGTIPGWKLGYGAKRRVWKEGVQDSVFAALKVLGVHRQEVFTEPEFLSPPKIEKLLKEKGKWPKKPRKGERPPTPLDPFIAYSMPEPRVMPVEAHDESFEKLQEAEQEFK